MKQTGLGTCRILAGIFILIIWTRAAGAGLNLPVTVKECNGVDVQSWPVTTVIPLSKGKYVETGNFRLTDETGASVPAQFEVLNRWNDADQSIRHLSMLFQPTVEAFQAAGSGTATYYLEDDGPCVEPETRVTITETPSAILIDTGPLSLVVNKETFSILDQVFLGDRLLLDADDSSGGVFHPRSEAGDIQYDTQRTDIRFTVEETGPMRAVVRAEALTLYQDTINHAHGFAVRLYAYAGKSFVKIDYQLQNSAKNVEYAWPLYFEALNLEFPLLLEDSVTVRMGRGDGQAVFSADRGENGYNLAQDFHNTFKIYQNGQTDPVESHTLENGQGPGGFIDIEDGSVGVMAAIRYFWQTWPNGLGVDGENRLTLALFPDWSAQWHENQVSDTGLYWLEDMQHIYKETLLYFHESGLPDQALQDMSKTFNTHPVGTLPVAWYGQARASLDLDGVIPIDTPTASTDERHITYSDRKFQTDHLYNFGWDNFLLDVNRKLAPSTAGNWPYSVARFIATENPADYWYAEQFAMGELNVRPQWMAQYSHETDYALLQLTENPYAGASWRNFKGHGTPMLDAPYLAGTAQDVKPRDDEHAWFYHMEEAYYFTANPWIRDWYEFIAEFRKIRLQVLDPWPNSSSRARGHALHHALQAFRVTGQHDVLDQAAEYIRTVLRPEQQENRHGGFDSISSGGEAAFQAGYLARAVISFLGETEKDGSCAYGEGFNLVAGIMDWNRTYSNFGYYLDAGEGEIGSSSGTGLTLVDPVAWYYRHTGDADTLAHLDLYLEEGINDGSPPYGSDELSAWSGDFVGRYNHYIHDQIREDVTPPSAVDDLEVSVTGTEAAISFTVPEDASEYQVLYSNLPIRADHTVEETENNWWAASSAGFFPDATPGDTVSVSVNIDGIDPVYVAVVCFDEAGNMEPIAVAPDPCKVDADSDGDTDGKDLAKFAMDFITDCLEKLASEFGH